MPGFTGIVVRKSAPRTLKYRWRRSANPGAIAMNGTAKRSGKITADDVEDGAYHCTMTCLAWIASELGWAASFPKADIIPQKSQREEDQGCWLEPAQPIRHTPRRHCSAELATPGMAATRN
jgi:hypothetical protein